MVVVVAIFLSGLLIGIILTGILACHAFGLLHAEAVRAFEDHHLTLALTSSAVSSPASQPA
ncbi:MAG TPA: hypothetical protein VFF94_05300 [Novosphingobium sp.]|nr:hypothetical protein [Novosphingobium sp.]